LKNNGARQEGIQTWQAEKVTKGGLFEILLLLFVQGFASSIAHHAVDANNFELKLVLISMVQQSHFGGTPLEDPNLHLSVCLEVCNTLKLNGVSSDVIRLRLFPFSLRDKARAWLPLLAIWMHYHLG